VDSRADVGSITVPYTGTAVLTYEDGNTIEQTDKGQFSGVTVGQVRVEISGPFDIPPRLSGLAPGTHVAPLNDPRYPHVAAQTIVVV
jgi:hypothetical protein